MKKLLAIILCASIVTPAFVFASEKAEQKRDNDYRKSSQLIEKTEKKEKKDRELKSEEERGEAKKEAHKEKVEEKKDNKKENSVQKHVSLVTKRLETAIDRVQKLSTRVGVALDRYSTRGVNVDASRAYLLDANANLTLARTKLAGLNGVVIAPTTTASSTTATTTPVVVAPGDALKNIQATVKDITKIILDAHKSVAKAISSVKPGRNTLAPTATSTTPTATTTPAVIATTTTN